ncbi:cytochrome c oxidase assembly protein [Tepidamorphus sp. 3E244]|uniref:cytochrome c oxidase assembly protein n=1 Tax=Tepidamorphus sp. 3E244 TaxID=3385498 RepID=UPI0038FC1148
MRPAALAGAGFVLLAVWVWPAPAFGLPPFTLFMLRHVVTIAIVAPLLVLAAPATFHRFAPSPLIATLLEFAIVWVWHLPALHERAAFSSTIFAGEQVSFLVAGVLLWASVLWAGNGLAGAGGLLITSMHMTLLGALLTLAPRPLYIATCLGPDPLADQQMGGMVMLAVATPVYLVAGLVLMYRVLSTPAQAEQAA